MLKYNIEFMFGGKRLIIFLQNVDDHDIRDKLEKIYLTYNRELLVTAYDILKDYHEAEDMVQNVIIRLENHLDKITEITSKKTRAYLMIIVRNLSINAYNKRKKTVLMDNDLAEGLLDEYNETYFENEPIIELCKELETSLSKLNESYTDILTLRYFYELTIDEIAKILDMSKNVVNVKLHRARAALKSIMMKEGR